MFSSGLAACGPVGTFSGQVNYVGDFRVLFDYFFPEVIPGSAIDIPFYVVKDWFIDIPSGGATGVARRTPRARSS